MMIGEIMKRFGCRIFLPLKQHRRAGAQEEQGGRRAKSPGRRKLLQAFPKGSISDLIVVLNKGDESRCIQIQAGRSARPFGTWTPLTLKQISPLHGGKDFLRSSLIIAVVKIRMAG